MGSYGGFYGPGGFTNLLGDAYDSEIVANAQNNPPNPNPAYTADDFLGIYPQFAGSVSPVVMSQFISLALATVNQARWREWWPRGMANFIAHHLILYLKMTGKPGMSVDQLISDGQVAGLATSKSVGGVSVSYDYSAMNSGEGWNAYRNTIYGQMYKDQASLLGKGGVYLR